MSNTTDTSTINLINKISSELNGYMTLFVFLFGIIGNILNIFILSQSTLRSNPCVLYFLGSSVSSLGIILVGLPSHLIAGYISTDPTNTNSLLCKIRIFFLYGFRTTSVWLIVLAAIDRWFLSSTKITRRRLSSRKIAYRGLIIIPISSFILWSESIFCYDTNLPQAPLRCYGKSYECRVFNDLVYASSTVMIPSLLMLIFGFLTIHNINRTRRAIEPFIATVTHIDPLNRRKRRRRRRNQSSLTRMLLLQVIFLTLFSLPQAIHQFYLTLTIQVIKSPLRTAIENFIVNSDLSLTYVGNASPFYIYTLTGTMFRQTLTHLIRSTIRHLILYLSTNFNDLTHFLLTVFRPHLH
jgi:hypothetical protein